MAVRAVHVHIGPYKTGTTYVQDVLWRNKALLAGRGVLVPRDDWPQQRRAVAALLLREDAVAVRLPRGPRGRARPRDAWDRLVAEVAESDAHTAVVSVERLCEAEPRDVAALVGSLEPAEVHVVCTARDLSRVVPGDWQTRIRNRDAPTWGDYLDSLRSPAGPDSWGGRFWHQQDLGRVLGCWLTHVPPARVRVVTVPRPGCEPALLWHRFCAATGLDPDGVDLDVTRRNASLGGVETEVLRRLTAATAGSLPFAAYLDWVNHFAARDVLEARAQSFRLELPVAERDWVDARAAAAAAFVREGGVPVHGDLDDLRPRWPGPDDPPVRPPDDVDDADVLTVTADLLARTVLEVARRYPSIGPRSEASSPDASSPDASSDAASSGASSDAASSGEVAR